MMGSAVNRSVVRQRLIMIFMITVLIVLLLISRLAWIQIVQADELYELAWNQWNHLLWSKTGRGNIYDRNGVMLAGSTTVDTVAAIPIQITDPIVTAEALAPILDRDIQSILNLITMDRSAVYIKRKLDPGTANKVRELNLPGIIFFDEEKRYYPGENLASQLLGFVGMDQGWAGLEVYYEGYLSGSDGSVFYPADGRGQQLPHTFSGLIQSRQGYDLFLSIDESMQYIVERELDRTMSESAPKLAMAIIMDPNSGAVLAAAARPDYNPDFFGSYNPDNWNLATFNYSLEPGSTFKLITLAAALEEGLFSPDDRYYCSGFTNISGHKIDCWTADRGGHGDISYYESFAFSCNTAFIELGRKLGKELLFSYIDAFGFGHPTGIDYPGESSGLIFKTDQVGPLELASTSFGQGISITPIQLVTAVSAMVNGGYLYRPYLVEQISSRDGEVIFDREPELIKQVISARSSQQLVDMMESVILEGTGYRAAVEGYRVGGKTGTAEKVGPDMAYKSDEFVYSLIGFAPLEDPRLVLYVVVDGVTRGPRLGVYTSAPLFRRILEDVLNYLQVKPSEIVPLGITVPQLQNDSEAVGDSGEEG